MQLIERDFTEIITDIIRSIPPRRRRYFKKLEVIGSTSEGSLSSPLFNPICQEENNENICKELDIDVQMTYKDELKELSCLQDVKGNIGLVAIRSRCLRPRKHKKLLYDWRNTDFIQHYHLKKYCLDRITRLAEKENNNTMLLLKSYLKSQRRNFQNVNITDKSIISKATSQRYYELTIDQKIFTKLNLDMTLVIKTKFSPNVLNDFRKRTSYNLSKSVLDHLFIVAKSSHEEKLNKNTTEWSYSFCHVENHIFIDIFTDTQRLIYLITKSIFKKHIQPLNSNILTSYLMKTITLWSFETKQFSQDDWLDDKKILTTSLGLFRDLKVSFEKGFLPSYFIPKLNLMKGMDKKLIEDVIYAINHNVFDKPFDDLFQVQEIKDAQNYLQDIKNYILYLIEMSTFFGNLSPILNENKIG